MPEKLFKLIDIICESYDYSLEHFRPRNDDPRTVENERATFCNFAVRRVCEELKYTGFNNMLANDMVRKMENSPEEWRKISGQDAQDYANRGELVLAGQINLPHGHVAVCRPGVAAFSAKWQGKFVPKCMNIGAQVFLGSGVNFAFKDEPSYFWLLPKI